MPLIGIDDPLLRGGSGGTYYKFTQIGETVQGTVVDAKKTQQTDFDTGEKLTFDNGDPRMQIVVTVQTTLRNDPEDTGLRDLYIKGQQPTQALSEAIKASGADGLDVGGTLVMQHTHMIPNVRNGRQGFPSKGFAFAYQPPSLLSVGQVAQPAAPQVAPPVIQQPPVVQQPVVAPAFQQPVPQTLVGGAQPQQGYQQAQIPGVGQLMGQPPVAAPPVVQQPAAQPQAPQVSPEAAAAIAALTPEQRAALGL